MKPTLTIRDRRFEPYIPAEAIHAAISDVAGRINRDYANAARPLLLVTLNGAFVFAGELFRQLTGDFEVAFVKLSSYEGLGSSGTIQIDVPLTTDVRGRDVLIAEDVVDTGATIHKLQAMLAEQGARSVRVATLLLKPETYYHQTERPEPLPIDYAALEAEPKFIIGYGMDYDGLGRNLGALYAVCEDELT
ncbi:phosphoribosyltransferase family protein [uncultured Rikenella sp.]|uniref:phosphoribosyltransferase n=1 Tax=uncultured Rikenella sp. TaxID=368003 RepID=UPI0026309AA6|nr:phosphoribosyltransferase family protein [uncultured Rikenella sp.]